MQYRSVPSAEQPTSLRGLPRRADLSSVTGSSVGDGVPSGSIQSYLPRTLLVTFGTGAYTLSSRAQDSDALTKSYAV